MNKESIVKELREVRKVLIKNYPIFRNEESDGLIFELELLTLDSSIEDMERILKVAKDFLYLRNLIKEV
ncbi:MAG: hypothetical protein ACRC0A_00880 [Chitinophagaceae bacterium]